MKPSGILIHDTGDLRAEVINFGSWVQLRIGGTDPHGFYVGFAFDGGDGRQTASRLAIAFNRAMSDPADDPVERAKLHAILSPVEAPNEFYRD